jgi:hypothetical protein
MKTVIIIRDTIGRKQCMGICVIRDAENRILFTSQSIERGWNNNQKSISCVPEGKYMLRKDWSPSFNMDLWEIYGVQNRSECKFHVSNYSSQLNGCIALGKERVDIDGDGHLDVNYSMDTMKAFHQILKGENECQIHIINSKTTNI